MGTKLSDLGYLTVSETAAIYGVVPGTLANWRSKRIGPPWYKLHATCVLYRVDEVREHLASRRQVPDCHLTS
jgi:hypothetical protein